MSKRWLNFIAATIGMLTCLGGVVLKDARLSILGLAMVIYWAAENIVDALRDKN